MLPTPHYRHMEHYRIEMSNIKYFLMKGKTNTEGAKKMYTHFKKGKNCIKIVILNIYVWLLQLQEVLKVVTISVQTLPITANYCLSNVDQSVCVSLKMCIHFFGTFDTHGICKKYSVTFPFKIKNYISKTNGHSFDCMNVIQCDFLIDPLQQAAHVPIPHRIFIH
jgi:hypothetical protein